MMKNYLLVACTLSCLAILTSHDSRAALRAGAAAIDVTPKELPVIQNGGFLERQVRLVADPIYARALVIESGGEMIALVVVDSCMMHREFCDEVKAAAEQQTGIASDRIMISATHTHSAPSVMDFCLGTRADPKYSEFLPGKIVEAIVGAKAKLRPAKAGWTRFDAGDFTKNRRWIFRSGLEQVDPFGQKTVRANMHPGYLNPNAVGESGPTDPWFTMLSLRGLDDRPIAVFGNFSMHYFSGHAGISADYFGHYVRGLEKRLATDDPDFVAILSQGTSGDLWRADYSKPKPEEAVTIERYAADLVDRSVRALEGIRYQSNPPVKMAEDRYTVGRRVPGAERLAWARGVVAEMGERRPKNRTEVYAEQAIYLHEHPEAEVVSQAIRIGELGINTMPNEVYALTGLKMRYRSPLAVNMTIELANGASGYIPPKEQYVLGGYNTWPSRTAGLVEDAESMIVSANLRLLEAVSGEKARNYREPPSPYALAVLKARPRAYWRLGDLDGEKPDDVAVAEFPAEFEPGVVFHLPAEGGRRCAHFAGGRLAAKVSRAYPTYSVVFWVWNGVPHGSRPVTGYLFSRGKDGAEGAPGEHLGIGGTHSHAGRLFVFNGNEKADLLAGNTELGVKKWHHVAMIRRGGEVRVYLDGREEINGELEQTHGGSPEIFFGGRSDQFANLEGRLDEAAFFDRALTAKEVRDLYASSAEMAPPASDPQASLDQVEVPDGFEVELVAAEPLVVDPVALDWAADGAVWVAEMADYPYGVEAGGRVARLTDTDGDGRLDQREEILNGLSFPAGVMAWRNGVIITAAPDILYAEDRDGDGRAEHVEKWFSGFIEGNQQLRVNGLRMGLDGWIYCASGGHHAGFGVDTVVTSHKTGQKIQLGSRDFRFKPDGQIEPESGPSQFGRVRDDFGNWFGVQNAYPLWHFVLPDRYLRRNPDASAPDPRKQLRDHQPRLFPAKESQKRFHGFDHVGRYTSACGISIYRDELLFPRRPGETIAFTCAPFHNVVQRHLLKPDGVSFSAQRADDGATDFFASRDRWCRPVMSRTGPDGALWVVDMYRYMIEHPDWLPQEGKDELRPHYRAGEERGRIYRIYPTGKRPELFVGLDQEQVRRGNGIVHDLVLRDPVWAAAISEKPAGRALHLAMGGDPVRSLGDDDPRVRSLAVRFSEGLDPVPEEVFQLVGDPSAKVRLQLAFSLGEWDGAEAARSLVEIALKDGADPYARAAILSSARPHFDDLLKALVTSDRADPKLMESLLAMAPPDVAVPLLVAGENPSDAQLINAARWLRRHPDTRAQFGELMAMAEKIYLDAGQAVARRIAALPLFVDSTRKFPPGRGDEASVLRAAIIACCERDLGQEVISNWARFSPELRALAIDQCMSSAKNVTALIGGLRSEVSPSELSASQRQRLAESKDPAVKAAAKSLFGTIGGGREKVLEAYRPSLQMAGDPSDGRGLFRSNCAACHELEGVGSAVGPDLRTITSRSKPALLSAILEPSRNVEPRYLAYSARGSDSVLAFGMIAAETATSVIFRLPDGSEKPVLRKEIVALESLGRSLMPDGLEASLDQQGMADLLAYLTEQLSSAPAP